MLRKGQEMQHREVSRLEARAVGSLGGAKTGAAEYRRLQTTLDPVDDLMTPMECPPGLDRRHRMFTAAGRPNCSEVHLLRTYATNLGDAPPDAGTGDDGKCSMSLRQEPFSCEQQKCVPLALQPSTYIAHFLAFVGLSKWSSLRTLWETTTATIAETRIFGGV